VLAGHRLLVVGPAPLPGAVARTPGLRVWPRGGALPRVLDGGMVVVAAPGAATGVARELGAMVLSPPGATGGPDTDLTAKAVAAVRVLESRSAARVVVHVGGADEAAHVRDAAGKDAFLSRVDAELIAPLAAAARVCGATVRVCPDHGCDPATGEHVADPVPCLDWPGGGTGWRRLSERDAAGAPLVDLTRVTAVAA
jgi:2,3-bisphosphoglycerate-independent phosphoglycerate mutase